MSDGMTETNRQSCYAQLEEVQREYGEHLLRHRALETEYARLTRLLEDHGPEGRNVTNQQWVDMVQENAKLREALEYYADPETYHACMFLFDRPAGKFEEDFSSDHGNQDYDRPMPGAIARHILANHSADADKMVSNIPLPALKVMPTSKELADALKAAFTQRDLPSLSGSLNAGREGGGVRLKKFYDGFGWHIKGNLYGRGIRFQKWVKGLVGLRVVDGGVSIGIWWGVHISIVWIHPNRFDS